GLGSLAIGLCTAIDLLSRGFGLAPLYFGALNLLVLSLVGSRARAADRELAAFLQLAVHELRNPLATLATIGMLLRREVERAGRPARMALSGRVPCRSARNGWT